VFSTYIKRPAQNWNIENRAQAFLEKQEKPKVAPRHPTTKKLIDDFSKEHPEIEKTQVKKDENLAKMLQGLVVNPERMGQFASVTKKQNLPLDRAKAADDEFGYTEPQVIRPGRCSIRQALEFIGDHYQDSTSHSAALIAKQYNLDSQRVEHVLRHFHVFHVQMPRQNAASADTSALGEAKALKPKFFKSLAAKGSDSSSEASAVRSAGDEK